MVRLSSLFFEKGLSPGRETRLIPLQEPRNASNRTRRIKADSDEFELLPGILAVDFCQIGKLCHARTTTRRPNIYQTHSTPPLIRYELSKEICFRKFHRDRLRFPLGIFTSDHSRFFLPLHRTTRRARLGHRRLFSNQNRYDSITCFILLHGPHPTAAIVHSPIVAELEIFIKDEDMRRRERAKGLSRSLRLTVV